MARSFSILKGSCSQVVSDELGKSESGMCGSYRFKANCSSPPRRKLSVLRSMAIEG